MISLDFDSVHPHLYIGKRLATYPYLDLSIPVHTCSYLCFSVDTLWYSELVDPFTSFHHAFLQSFVVVELCCSYNCHAKIPTLWWNESCSLGQYQCRKQSTKRSRKESYSSCFHGSIICFGDILRCFKLDWFLQHSSFGSKWMSLIPTLIVALIWDWTDKS